VARTLYTIAFYLLLPFILVRLLWRSRKAPDYKKRWAERFGFFLKPRLQAKVIWVHAVSVGESLAAIPLIEKLLEKKYVSIVVTTTTPTGSDRIRHRFSHYLINQGQANQVFHVYCPYDLPDCIWRFLNRIQPSAFIVMETELWPNIIACCNKRNIPVILANGRLSEKSAQGYEKIHRLMRPVFAGIDAAAVQAEADAERMQTLGLSTERCIVTGSIKFDLQLDDRTRAEAAQLKSHINSPLPCKTLIAASTHAGEEDIVLQAFRTIKESVPNCFLILVPRHPERFESVAELIKEAGFNVNRRSDKRLEVESEVLLGDSMGELLTLLGAADTAFVGGSFVAVGGHNLMEPAAWALPILTGPHLFNFSEASALLAEKGGLIIIQNGEQLAATVLELWSDENKGRVMGEAALAVANSNRGALDKLLDVINGVIVARNQSVQPD
jgi:3-deoxy-D-manno-octulosonic-acid transferase